MSSSRVRVDLSDWTELRGSVEVSASRDFLQSLVRNALVRVDAFAIVEFGDSGGIVANRTTLLARAETFRLEFKALSENSSVVEISSKASNRFGLGPGLERRSRHLRELLDVLDQQSALN